MGSNISKKHVFMGLFISIILLLSIVDTTSVKASKENKNTESDVEITVKNEDGEILKDDEVIRIEDVITYEVKVENNTESKIFIKIKNEVPMGATLLLFGKNNPVASLSNGEKVYVNIYEDEISTNIMEILPNEEVILKFDVLAEIISGKIRNSTTIEYYEEDSQKIIESKDVESGYVMLNENEEELVKAKVSYFKEWEDGEVSNIDVNYNMYFSGDRGINSRVRDIVNGFSYIKFSEIYIGKTKIYEFGDSLTRPSGDRLFIEDELLDTVNDQNLLRIIHYYY